MEIIDPNSLVQVTKEITLKALDKNLITVNTVDSKEAAKNIADFYHALSDALSEQ